MKSWLRENLFNLAFVAAAFAVVTSCLVRAPLYVLGVHRAGLYAPLYLGLAVGAHMLMRTNKA